MGSKLLFVFGIVLAHGALAAAWVRQDAPQARGTLATCINNPVPMPYFQPPRELLAHVIEIQSEDLATP
jgi:hypothetical protein